MSGNKNLKIWLAMALLIPLMPCLAGAKIIYVDDDANGLNNGSSWTNAYNYLQDALADANSSPKPVEIRVAQGIYRPEEDTLHPNGTGDREATFQLINGVTLKGGYAGAGEPDPNARDIKLYETILSGDLNGDDLGVTNPLDLLDEHTRSENSFHVVSCINDDATAVLDGFTITAGNANVYSYSSPQRYGGGIYIHSANPMVSNCFFLENSGYDGGAAFVNSSNPAFTDCVFIENSAADGGGGIRFWEGSAVLNDCNFVNNWSQTGGAIDSSYCSLSLTNCSFNSNSATFGCGGGWNNAWGHSTVTNCTFNNNLADYGGGIANGGAPLLLNCVFRGNSAGYIGGGMCNFDTDGIPVTINCLFEGNSADYGGGMYNNETEPTLINCRFSGNLAYESGGGISNPSNFTSPTLINCILCGNVAYQNGGAIDCFGSSPILINCTINGNKATKQGGGILLAGYGCSLRVINAILWGDTSGKDGPEIAINDSDSTLIVTHSDVQGGKSAIYDPYGTVIWGAGNIDADPCFANPGYWDPNGTLEDANDDFWVDGDYHLKSQAGRWDPNSQSWVKDGVTSRCIDAGDPSSPIGLEPFPNGGIINMGAYGGSIEASKSYFGEPVCETIVAGDINGDCKVDFRDFALMAFHWLEEH
jgi:predicted outer membrane repeat protein